jgi:hypothetical protein
VPEHLRHDTRNLKVEIVSLFSHEGETMVDICRRKYEWGLEELKDKFCLVFFPMSHIDSLPRTILDFEQYARESIGAAWARFSMLIHASPDLSLSESMLLHLFCSGLNIEAALYLDMTIRGSFTHKTMTKQKKILAHILENHAPSIVEPKPLQKKGMSSFEEPSTAESKLVPFLDLIDEPSPKPRHQRKSDSFFKVPQSYHGMKST